MSLSLPTLVIHGGAGRKPDASRALKVRDSLSDVLKSVYPRLKSGLSATAAVVEAVRLLENDPFYNAGKGSKIQSDGRIRMSASVMDGGRQRFAGCVNVEGLRNPVLLARALLSQRDRVLAGRGAAEFARELGLEFASPYTSARREEFSRALPGKSGTVGAVAVDLKGRTAAATSTGGRGFEFPHRVSDSPTCAGNFAGTYGAVSATGYGEQIVDFAAAATIHAWLAAGMDLQSSVQELMRNARARGAQFGVIAVDARGHHMAATTTAGMIWAAATPVGRWSHFK